MTISMNFILIWRKRQLEGESKKENVVKHAASIYPSSGAVIRLRPALVQCERNWSELKCVVCW